MDDGDFDLTRVAGLSDGVFAVAMTLLIAEVHIPHFAESGGMLVLNFGELWPQLMAITLGFFVSAIFWMSHHRLFRLLRHGDRTFIWLNNLLLFGIAIQPLTTELIGDFPHQRTAMIVYAGNLALVGFVQFAMWAYALNHGRLARQTPEAGFTRRALLYVAITPVLFAISIPAAFWDTRAALVCWALTGSAIFLAPRRTGRPAA